MNKLLSYGISVVGILIILLGINVEKLTFMPDFIKPVYVLALGVILVAVGIFFVMNESRRSSSIKHAAEEVPIYEGVGKKRRIIGYRKD